MTRAEPLYDSLYHCTTLCFAIVNKEPFCGCRGLYKVNAVVVYKKSRCRHISVLFKIKPRNLLKISSEQSSSACHFSHWKGLNHSPMESSINRHRNFNLIEWKVPLEFVNFGKCSSISQFAEIQIRFFHRMESAIDFSVHGACFLNCFSHYHLVILISI